MKYPRGIMFMESIVKDYVSREVYDDREALLGSWSWYKSRLLSAGVLTERAKGVVVLPYGWAVLMEKVRALDAERRLGGPQ